MNYQLRYHKVCAAIGYRVWVTWHTNLCDRIEGWYRYHDDWVYEYDTLNAIRFTLENIMYGIDPIETPFSQLSDKGSNSIVEWEGDDNEF